MTNLIKYNIISGKYSDRILAIVRAHSRPARQDNKGEIQMTSLLIRLFVKDRNNVADPAVRGRYALLASVTGIILNILLSVSKLALGLITASVAVVADAFNNLSDASSSVVTLVGFKMSSKHADKKHPMGHGRIEYISAFIVDALIIAVGFELLTSSVGKIITPELPDVSDALLIMLGAAILVKLWLFFYYGKIAKKIKSAAIRASSFDSISDTVATSLVLASALISRYTSVAIDGWAGLAVAAFILFTGFKAAAETIGLLVGSSPDPDFIKKIYEFVKRYPQVIGIHDLMVHDYGPGRVIVSFHAEVPSDSNFSYAHDIIDCIERDMHEELGCIVTIHIDPIELNDEKVNEMRKLAEETAKEVDPSFTIHDFRMTYGGKHYNMIFDLSIPTDSKFDDEDAAKLVADKLKEKNPDYYAVIKAEHPFV